MSKPVEEFLKFIIFLLHNGLLLISLKELQIERFKRNRQQRQCFILSVTLTVNSFTRKKFYSIDIKIKFPSN